MSKQPRQPKKPPTDAPVQGTEAGHKDKDPAAETHESSARQGITLPAFGFAEDLLQSKSESPNAAPHDTDEATPHPDDVPQGPERIFAFADQLSAASAPQPTSEPAQAQRLETWITFVLADEIYALPVSPVKEALRVSLITRVPHAPQPVRGVTNLRGRVLPVIDLRLRIGLQSTDIERGNRILVVSARNRQLGLLVDAVLQVVHIDLNRIEPPPEDVMTAQSDYITGVYHHCEELILLLDVERALIIHEAPNAA